MRSGPIIALATVLAVGCNPLDESRIDELRDAHVASDDLGTAVRDSGEPPLDSGRRPDGAAEEWCVAGSPPPRPPSSTEGDDVGEIVMGLKEVLLNPGDTGWREIGLNLDNYCSEPPTPEGECVPPDRDASLLSDGTDGIDNAFGAELYPLIELVFPELQATARMSAERGKRVLVLRVRGYNGGSDDPRVDVTVSQSVTGFGGTAGQTAPPDYSVVDFEPYQPDGTTRLQVPAWDGNDWLVLRDDTFLSGNLEQPLVRDDNAYVAGGQLVARLPSGLEIRFAGDDNGITIRLSDATLVGSLDVVMASEFVVAGRWSVADLLRTTESLGVCEGDSEYDIFRNELDTAADIRATPGTGGEDVECDALSIGMTFQGYPTRIAGVTEGEAPPDACP